MNARVLWSRILIIVGTIAMLIGAIDPLEGSLIILFGSGLVTLGTYLGQGGHRILHYWTWVFILIVVGVGVMWGLSALGGLGGSSGRSLWWGLLILPYPVGWIMGIISLIVRSIGFLKSRKPKV
jgi:purine-cytosine permease-like protein